MTYENAEKSEDKLRKKNEDLRSRQTVDKHARQILLKVQPFFVFVLISLYLLSFLTGLFGIEGVGNVIYLFLFLSALAATSILFAANIEKE